MFISANYLPTQHLQFQQEEMLNSALMFLHWSCNCVGNFTDWSDQIADIGLFGKYVVTKDTVILKSLFSAVAASLVWRKKTHSLAPHATLLQLSHWAYTLSAWADAVNKGATCTCINLEILNIEAVVKVITGKTMVCFSCGPQAGSLTSHWKDSCVKEIDRRASSNQQLPPRAIHMHTACDVHLV